MSRPCEFCGHPAYGEDNTVCAACDKQMMETDKDYFAALERKHSKFKCQSCKGPLPLSRARVCEHCVAHNEMPSHNLVQEAATSMELGDEDFYVQRRSHEIIQSTQKTKTCATCGKRKSSLEFAVSKGRVARLAYQCKPCARIRYREAEQRRRARLAQVKQEVQNDLPQV